MRCGIRRRFARRRVFRQRFIRRRLGRRRFLCDRALPDDVLIDYRINRCPKGLPKVSDQAIDWERYIERQKSSVRRKVERAFRVIKRRFDFSKIPLENI